MFKLSPSPAMRAVELAHRQSHTIPLIAATMLVSHLGEPCFRSSSYSAWYAFAEPILPNATSIPFMLQIHADGTAVLSAPWEHINAVIMVIASLMPIMVVEQVARAS